MTEEEAYALLATHRMLENKEKPGQFYCGAISCPHQYYAPADRNWQAHRRHWAKLIADATTERPLIGSGENMTDCKDCSGNGGWLVNPDYPMGDCGDREWVPCKCGSLSRKDELWAEHLRQYGHTRFGTPL